MQENPYAPPKADLEIKKSKAIVLASRGKRLKAAIIDSIISLIIVLPVMYFTGGFEGTTRGHGQPLMYTVALGLFGVLIFIIIHGRFLVQYGQTVGKRLVGIKITDLDGNLPTIKRHIFPRYAFTTILPYIPILGGFLPMVDVLFIFGKNRRCVHDYVANTIVIDD